MLVAMLVASLQDKATGVERVGEEDSFEAEAVRKIGLQSNGKAMVGKDLGMEGPQPCGLGTRIT